MYKKKKEKKSRGDPPKN